MKEFGNWLLNIAFFTLFSSTKTFGNRKDDGFLIGFRDDFACFLIQYFYQTDALDYRLLAPFILEFGWFISKTSKFLKNWFCHRFLSLMTGFVFSYFPEVIIWKTEKLMKEFWLTDSFEQNKFHYYFVLKKLKF